MRIKVPEWVKKEEGQKGIIKSLLGEVQTKKEYFRSKMLPFEKKYGTDFLSFEEKVEALKKENFEEWDDLIIWEGFYRGYQEWKRKHEDLLECIE